MIGIFTWWHIGVEAALTIGNMLIAIYAGSLVYQDTRVFAEAGFRAR